MFRLKKNKHAFLWVKGDFSRLLWLMLLVIFKTITFYQRNIFLANFL